MSGQAAARPSLARRLRPGMEVMVFEQFAVREKPLGRAELLEREPKRGIRRAYQLEHWRVRYLGPPPDGCPHPSQARPEWVTIRTDAEDLRAGPDRVPLSPIDFGPTVPC